MDVLQWYDIDECLFIAETDEVYKKYAGLKHSNELILSLANLRLLNSKALLKKLCKTTRLVSFSRRKFCRFFY